MDGERAEIAERTVAEEGAVVAGWAVRGEGAVARERTVTVEFTIHQELSVPWLPCEPGLVRVPQEESEPFRSSVP